MMGILHILVRGNCFETGEYKTAQLPTIRPQLVLDFEKFAISIRIEHKCASFGVYEDIVRGKTIIEPLPLHIFDQVHQLCHQTLGQHFGDWT